MLQMFISESSLEFMLQMFLELQPKIKNCLPCPPRPALPCPVCNCCPALFVTATLPLPCPSDSPNCLPCPAPAALPFFLGYGFQDLDGQTDRHCNFNILDYTKMVY
jgi:hypothetical protein